MDVVHGARVVPAARVPRAHAAPENVRPTVGGGDLPDGLAVVEPGAARLVEVAVVAGAQPGRVEVNREGSRLLDVRHPAPEERAVAVLVLDLDDAEGAD